MEAPSFDYMLRQGAVLGLAFVFLAGVLVIILWVAVVIVRIANKYAVAWFESSIDSHRQVAAGVKRMSRAVMVMYRNNKTTNDALHHTISAVDLIVTQNAERVGVSREALDQLRYARHILRRREEFEQRVREQDEREEKEQRQREEASGEQVKRPSDSETWDSLTEGEDE